MFKKIIRFFKGLYRQHEILNAIKQQTQTQVEIAVKEYELLAHREIDRLRSESPHQDKKSLIPFGYKIFSQNDEDGIIEEIFNRIGVTNKVFVEFGVGNGLENNTLALLFKGWSGLWIEAESNALQQISNQYQSIINEKRLKVTQAFIKKDNINHLISSSLQETEIDFLSVDIDGNDYHILDVITCITPRVIAIEYNAKFAPPMMYCMNYDEDHIWEFDDCFGASLKFLEVNLKEKGYSLVGCNINGVNAFFVKSDIASDKFLMPYTAEHHYAKARYYLSGISSGHRSSHKTLSNSL